jgi:hypothetical protein
VTCTDTFVTATMDSSQTGASLHCGVQLLHLLM